MTDPDSSSEDELHDVEWVERDAFFDYTDPYAMSPQITAVMENDVRRLKSLIRAGKSANINDNCGNTPLHVAVTKEKEKAFNYLLSLSDVRIDAENFEGATPLVQALICINEYFALELIKKGADVNLARNTGYTPLHYSVSNTLRVGKMLVERGAELNAQSCLGETPLYVACERGNCDLIYMLLYYGADATIPCSEGILPFTLSMSKCPVALQEILFDYTFDENKVPMSLYTLDVAMSANSPLFYKIANKTSEVVYTEKDLKHLSDSLPFIKAEVFRVFMSRFEDVAKDMFCVCNSLMNYVTFLGTCINENPNFVDFMYMLCDSALMGDVVQNYHPKVFLVHCIITRHISEDTLTKLMCCLMSHGVGIIADDLNTVYNYYGFCELFKMMLHMEITDCVTHNEEGTFEPFLIPILMYDINLDIDMCLGTPQKYIFPDSLHRLFKYFALPKLKEYCVKSFRHHKAVAKIKYLPQVPSLVELGRNAARKHIIKRYNVKSCAQFFTVLRWLPINKIYKAILTYEKELYSV